MAEQVAVLAGGCFWCTEAVFLDVIGVSKVESGYTGGTLANPTYKQVCGGNTGHAEAIRVTFDPEQISYDELLDIFFATHDPTQLNRQGNDVGTQYRSAIFPQNAEQEQKAREAIDRANQAIGGRVVTAIEPKGEWYPAEDYHQEYWAGEGQRNPYCLATIPPKLQKLRKSFQMRVKEMNAAVEAAARRRRSLIAAPRPSSGTGATAIRGLADSSP
jgi:peptide-methionine (S)-S-oxide reductase